MTPARRTARLAAVAFGLLASPTLADDGRELGGHSFMPVLGIVGPFAATSFGTFLTLGAGTTEGAVSLQLPGTSSPPQTFSGKVSYAVVGGVIGYEYAFLR